MQTEARRGHQTYSSITIHYFEVESLLKPRVCLCFLSYIDNQQTPMILMSLPLREIELHVFAEIPCS